jgi:hypothetical protein
MNLLFTGRVAVVSYTKDKFTISLTRRSQRNHPRLFRSRAARRAFLSAFSLNALGYDWEESTSVAFTAHVASSIRYHLIRRAETVVVASAYDVTIDLEEKQDEH